MPIRVGDVVTRRWTPRNAPLWNVVEVLERHVVNGHESGTYLVLESLKTGRSKTSPAIGLVLATPHNSNQASVDTGEKVRAKAMELKFCEPPTDRRNKWSDVFNELRAHPREWAIVREATRNRTAAGNIRAGVLGDSQPGEFEARSIGKGDGTFDIYARYVGSPNDDSETGVGGDSDDD